MDSSLSDASIVVVNYVIQFLDLEQRDTLLEKIYNALLPGGILILSEKIFLSDALISPFPSLLWLDVPSVRFV